MILDAACQYFGKTSQWDMSRLSPEPIDLDISPSNDDLEYWQQVFSQHLAGSFGVNTNFRVGRKRIFGAL